MHIHSETLVETSSPVTFVVGSWKSGNRQRNMNPTLFALASAALSSSSASVGSPQQSAWNTPSNLSMPTVSGRHTMMTPQALPSKMHVKQHSHTPLNRRDSVTPNYTNAAAAEEDPQRKFVLETIRRLKLTRRTVSNEANIREFRSMNYWLRGKGVDDPVVKEAGKMLCDWAAKQNVDFVRPGTSASRGKTSRDDESDEDDDDDADEEVDESPRSASAGKRPSGKSAAVGTPQQASKKQKQVPISRASNASSTTPSGGVNRGKNKVSPGPFPEPIPRSTAAAPLTPVLSRVANRVAMTPTMPTPGFDRIAPLTPYWEMFNSPVNVNSPFNYSPIPPSSVFKVRTASVDEPIRVGVTPVPSPGVSPIRGHINVTGKHADPLTCDDEMFRGVELFEATPFGSEKVSRVGSITRSGSHSSRQLFNQE